MLVHLLLSFFVGLASADCWTILDRGIARQVCDPEIIKPDVILDVNITNYTAWFYLPPRDPNQLIRLEVNLSHWHRFALTPNYVTLYTQFFDESGSDYPTTGGYPNVAYLRNDNNTLILSKPPHPNKPVFLRIWTASLDEPRPDVGPGELKLSYTPFVGPVSNEQPIVQTIQPNEWLFFDTDQGIVRNNAPLNYLQLLINCGNPEELTPLTIYTTSCSPLYDCAYPAIVTPFTTASKIALGETYQLGYPKLAWFPQENVNTHLLASIHNPYATACTVTIDAYTVPSFIMSSFPTTTPEVTIAPKRYIPFRVDVPGAGVGDNETIYVTLTPVGVSPGSLLALFYHPYPFEQSQDIISASFTIEQSGPGASFNTSFFGFGPYQPFSIFNYGNESGRFVLEVSKSGPRPYWFWILMGAIVLLCGITIGLAAFFVYKRNARGYATINDQPTRM